MKTAFHLPRRVVAALAFSSAAIIVFSMTDANTQSQSTTPLEVPARTLPVPDTVSPAMQRLIGAPLSGNWNSWPKTDEEWKKLSAAGGGRGLPALRERFKVKTEAMTVNGVQAYLVTPADLPGVTVLLDGRGVLDPARWPGITVISLGRSHARADRSAGL